MEVFRKYDELTNKHIKRLWSHNKIQQARVARDNDAIKTALKEYDDAGPTSVLMSWRGSTGTAKTPTGGKDIPTERGFCSEHEVWKLWHTSSSCGDQVQRRHPVLRAYREEGAGRHLAGDRHRAR